MKNSTLVIDGHNFLYKSYNLPFKFYSSSGIPLHVVTVFLNLIRRSFQIANKKYKCTKVIIVFDSQSSTKEKLQTFSHYKQNRNYNFSEGNSPFLHLPLIYKVLEVIGIQYIEIQNFEADDLIASITSQNRNFNYIASTDSDFYQLLNDKTFQIILKSKGQYTLIDEKYLYDNFKIYPNEYVKFKSLTGDKADNIDGIPNIGYIKAAKIIRNEYKFDLRNYKSLLDRNENLIRLNTNLSITTDFNQFVPSRLYMKNKIIFQECGFNEI